MNNVNQKGLVPIIYLLGVAVAILVSVVFVKTFVIDVDREETSTTGVQRGFGDLLERTFSIPTAAPHSTTPGSGSTKTTPPTTKPTATPATSDTSSTSCNYDFSSPTGAVEAIVQPQTGYLSPNPVAEIKALNGCKALDGQSRDWLTSSGYNTGSAWGAVLSGIPPGQYTVRINFPETTARKNVTVSSGQLSKVYFTISGNPAPTPIPRPVCSPMIAMPSASGSAPLTVSLGTGQETNGTYLPIQNVYWDFDGNGSWDLTASDLSSQSHTYTSAGTYYPKVYLLATNGQTSDICQTTISVY